MYMSALCPKSSNEMCSNEEATSPISRVAEAACLLCCLQIDAFSLGIDGKGIPTCIEYYHT